MQAVEELPLVLVDPFHMDVKHGGRVDLHLIFLFQELGEFQLIFLWRVDRPGPSSPGSLGGSAWAQILNVKLSSRDPRLAPHLFHLGYFPEEDVITHEAVEFRELAQVFHIVFSNFLSV